MFIKLIIITILIIIITVLIVLLNIKRKEKYNIMDQYLSNPDKYYVKSPIEYHEYRMHKKVYELNIVNIPKIVYYDRKTKTIVFEKIGNSNLSDTYGDQASDVPDHLFDQVVQITNTLRNNNIEYPDLTGYNFVEDFEQNGKIWIIDFEHAKTKNKDKIKNKHILDICNGVKKWNPDFY
jgi:tRNA A-37 threonylcarbamoyl transferase component Bud32